MRHLTPALVALLLLGSCSRAPHREGYFKHHRHETEHVLAACRDGSIRGSECLAAARAIAEMRRRARMAEEKEAFAP